MRSDNRNLPDERGYFGEFGGRFMPETLMPVLYELETAYSRFKADLGSQAELHQYLQEYAGRPSPLYFASRLTSYLGGARIYLKREDLNHTGSHKINNTLGQVLLARGMGKRRLIAETGAGQHGVAAATAAAVMGFECEVYMGEEDIKRQHLNVVRMELLGARVNPVTSGTRTLKDAMNEAIRDWVANVGHTYYLLGSVGGPHPYPMMVRDFQAIIGRETREQILAATGQLPDVVVACVGGGSNAIGIFYPFLGDDTALIGVEAAGRGLQSGAHAATLNCGSPGVLHGALSTVLQDEYGQILPAHSIAAGLDYPGVGPEHSYLQQSGRARYTTASDAEALAAFKLLGCLEGIIPALESSHALAEVIRLAPTMPENGIIVACLSGRGDKDVDTVAALKGVTL